MVVKLSRSTSGTDCKVELDDWSFVLKRPADFVLAFLNENYTVLKADHSTAIKQEQAEYCTEMLSQHSGAPLLRDMIDHVLVCQRERGFDPMARLAAHSFITDMFDLSRVASFSERVSLESMIVDTEQTDAVQHRWNGLIEENSQKMLPREDLFQSLLRDAESTNCSFALKLSMEFSSLPQLLKSCVIEMIRSRELLRRCNCGKYRYIKTQKCECKKK